MPIGFFMKNHQRKSEAHTNMQNGGAIPHHCTAVVDKLIFCFDPLMTREEVSRLVRDASSIFSFDNTRILTVPLSLGLYRQNTRFQQVHRRVATPNTTPNGFAPIPAGVNRRLIGIQGIFESNPEPDELDDPASSLQRPEATSSHSEPTPLEMMDPTDQNPVYSYFPIDPPFQLTSRAQFAVRTHWEPSVVFEKEVRIIAVLGCYLFSPE
jgi:hypothetical protein